MASRLHSSSAQTGNAKAARWRGTMKRLTNSMATAAAVLMVTAGVASAQNLMKAEVPFAFSVGNKVMEPGTIRVRLFDGPTGSGPITVNNSATQRTYVVLPKSEGDAPKQWIKSGQAKLAFTGCGRAKPGFLGVLVVEPLCRARKPRTREAELVPFLDGRPGFSLKLNIGVGCDRALSLGPRRHQPQHQPGG